MGKDLFGNEILDKARNMSDFFLVPPFSVINTMDEKWLNRKRRWLRLTGDLSETKEGVLFAGNEDTDSEISKKTQEFNGGSSNFDPALAEVMIKWFNIPGGHILDPFGGEQTKGIIAGELGYKYTAVEFRAVQCRLNQEKTAHYPGIKYHHGDSNNIAAIVGATGFDFCFTSPPYYDLEIYSKEDMSALGTYTQFMAQYKNIFAQCVAMLKFNRFLVVKVCEIRDKNTGEYRNFVGDNITIFKSLGLKYYNEIILVNSPGTLPLRSGRTMNASRKVGKQHQNLLVFFKGDLKAINKLYPELIPKNDYYD